MLKNVMKIKIYFFNESLFFDHTVAKKLIERYDKMKSVSLKLFFKKALSELFSNSFSASNIFSKNSCEKTSFTSDLFQKI